MNMSTDTDKHTIYTSVFAGSVLMHMSETSVTLYAHKFKHYWLRLQHVAQSVPVNMSDDLKISALKNGISMSIFFKIPNAIAFSCALSLYME